MTNLFNQISETIKHWYVPLIIGIIFIILGAYVFTVPLETYITLSIFFSISFIISGISDVVFALENKKFMRGWGWYLISGIFSLAMGCYLIAYPLISIEILPFVVAFTLLFRSFQLLGFSFDLRELNVVSWGDSALISVLGIIFSLLLLSNPIFTSMSLVTLTALTFIFVGVSSIMLSLNLKKLKGVPDKISQDLKNRIQSLQNEINDQIAK